MYLRGTWKLDTLIPFSTNAHPSEAREHMTQRKSTPHDESQARGSALDDSTRRRVVGEARRRFFSLGIRSVTMDDLAYDLGMSKRTLYQHFRTKADLVEAVFLDKFLSVEEDLTRISEEASSDCLGALRKLLACIQGHMGELQPPLMRDIRREAPMMFTQIEKRRSDMIHRHFGKILDEARSAGIIRKDIPIRLIVEIMLAAVQAIMNPEKLVQLDLTPKEGFTAILTVILKGATSEEERAPQ
jgi:AcrR family transcriptional regulator